MTATITSSVIEVTPKLAASLLEKNPSNRKVRASRVKEFVEVIKRGEWMVTNQGIGIATDGNLIDGQHRLMAIAQSGIPVNMIVTKGLQAEAKFVIDTHAKRSYSDLTGIDQSVLTPVVNLTRILTGKGSPRMSLVHKMLPHFLDISRRVQDSLGTKARRSISSSSVRAAAILRIAMGEDEKNVLWLYHKLLDVDTSDMPPIAHSFLKQMLHGVNQTGSGENARTLFIRAWIVFGRENRDTERVMIKSTEAKMAEIREAIRKVIGE